MSGVLHHSRKVGRTGTPTQSDDIVSRPAPRIQVLYHKVILKHPPPQTSTSPPSIVDLKMIEDGGLRPPSSISISGSLTADPPPQSTSEKASGSGAGAPAGVWGGSPSGVRGSAPHEISTKKGIKSEQFSTFFVSHCGHSLNNTFTLLLTTQHSSSTAAPIQNETLTACGDLPKLLWGLCTLLLHSPNHAGQCSLPILARCPSSSTSKAPCVVQFSAERACPVLS